MNGYRPSSAWMRLPVNDLPCVEDRRQRVPRRRLEDDVDMVGHEPPCLQVVPLAVEDLERRRNDACDLGIAQDRGAVPEVELRIAGRLAGHRVRKRIGEAKGDGLMDALMVEVGKVAPRVSAAGCGDRGAPTGTSTKAIGKLSGIDAGSSFFPPAAPAGRRRSIAHKRARSDRWARALPLPPPRGPHR